jgi:hypothetical protein
MTLQTATRSALIGLVACLTLASAALAQTSPPPLRAALPDNAEMSADPLPVLPGEVMSRVVRARLGPVSKHGDRWPDALVRQ